MHWASTDSGYGCQTQFTSGDSMLDVGIGSDYLRPALPPEGTGATLKYGFFSLFSA